MSTPFEQAGFTADDLLTIKADKKHFHFKHGETFKLLHDDGTICPFFTPKPDTKGYDYIAVFLDLLERVEQKPEGKTLLQILTEELPKRGGWPNNATHCVCMADKHFGNVSFTKNGAPEFSNVSNEWTILTDNYSSWHSFDFESELPIDRETAIITREQYEAALAASKEPLTGTGVDGWIDCDGCECPVPKGTVIDFKTRDGDVYYGEVVGRILGELWGKIPNCADAEIIAYRLHQPQEAEQAEADDEADLNDCIGQTPAPVWNGEGLPPVGVEFEYGSHRSRAKCLAIGLHYVFASKGNPDDEESDYEELLIDAGTEYHPVDEDRAAIRKVIKDTGIMSSYADKIANALIDAGYRKQ